MTRRRRRTREILDAAYALVAEGGIEAMSLHAVARQVGVTTPALYRYFGARDALLAALEVEVIDEIAEVLGRAVDSADDALSSLAAVVLAYGAWAERRPARFALLHAIAGDPRRLVGDEHVGPVLEALARVQVVVARALRGAVDADALEPGDEAGRLLALWSSVHGLRAAHKFAARLVDAERLHRVSIDLGCAMFVGWGAERADACAAFASADALPWDVLITAAVDACADEALPVSHA